MSLQVYKDGYERCLNEKDFMPIQDDRIIHSGVDDVDNGDSFYGYSKYFYDMYEEDVFDIDTDCSGIVAKLINGYSPYYKNN